MIERIRQFYRALTASITEADRTFVTKMLSPEAGELFWNMSIADQYHAIHVCYTAMDIASVESCNRELLIRTALLHDVGRKRGSMNVWEKSIAVLFQAVFPKTARKTGSHNKGWLSRIMFIYFNHPQIGADMLEKLQMKQEADIVRLHHSPARSEDCRELQILRIADSLN